jgi:hypothetical protein
MKAARRLVDIPFQKDLDKFITGDDDVYIIDSS